MNKDYFRRFALAAAPRAAAVANYCDHVEHNETAETNWILDAGSELMSLAFEFANNAGIDLLELYAERLRTIEAGNVLARPDGFDGQAAARSAATWRDLQLVQVEHDRCYHPDVFGLARTEQLRHYAFHLAKIVGAFADGANPEELMNRRLPDVLLFAVKLHTVMGKRLSDEPLSYRTGAGQAVAH
jgi:hypothetical protein